MIGSGSQRSETRSNGVNASPKVPSSKASACRPSGRGGLPPLRPELPVQSSVDLNHLMRSLEPSLRVRSEPYAGTRFEISFPIS